MNNMIKWGALAALVLVAYSAAWLKTYNLSQQYFEFATEQQQQQGNVIIALKGMNKLELRRGDEYLGGYQQVIETWEGAVLGPKPNYYYQALVKPNEIINQLSAKQLEEFIQIYVELDSRYVPEVADQLQQVASDSGNVQLASEMREFLAEAFPYYKAQSNTE
ncbi:hypothetical protein EGH82_14730 [Vibrio ponticus]|uniref:Uncharacterized protein n=1 Tax=Vibrio ponticus TaxID=265668 RepID=A0A3N3DY01_9VIBR|nr:hypothetical protein [Vibrio ponticus]ROV59230.1 hypothetical protein EGH82_14730 [Vibrio ponticus]